MENPGEDLAAEWLLGLPAVSLDPSTRTVELADGRTLNADAVVIATGSKARRLVGRPAGVHTIRSVDDAVALRADLRPGAEVAVVGAGFIGAEIASTLHGRGHPVTVIEAAPVPLASEPPEALLSLALPPSVVPCWAKAGAAASISVTDNGPGVAAKDRERIFEPFEQAAPRGEGAGLGLAISRRLARSMGGDISLDSTPGKGARFTLTLPPR